MKFSIINLNYMMITFMVILIAVLSPSLIPTNAKSTVNKPIPGRITQEFINNICAKVSSTLLSLCHEVLEDRIGFPINHETILNVLVTTPMTKLESVINSTIVTFTKEIAHSASIRKKPELRQKYEACWRVYTSASVQYFHNALRFMKHGNHQQLKLYAQNVTKGINNACEKEIQAKKYKDANKKLKDLCAIVEAICNKVSSF